MLRTWNTFITDLGEVLLQTSFSLKTSAHYWLEQIDVFLEHVFWLSLSPKESPSGAMRLLHHRKRYTVRKDSERWTAKPHSHAKAGVPGETWWWSSVRVEQSSHPQIAPLFSSWQLVWCVLVFISSICGSSYPLSALKCFEASDIQSYFHR